MVNRFNSKISWKPFVITTQHSLAVVWFSCSQSRSWERSVNSSKSVISKGLFHQKISRCNKTDSCDDADGDVGCEG